jgi:hypothetical protein
MIRLHIVAEGQTEESFVNKVLKPYLAKHNVFADVRCIETSRSKRSGKIFRGGFIEYAMLKKDIELWMKQDSHPNVRFTSMIDLYALPQDFPHSELMQSGRKPYQLVSELEDAFFDDINIYHFIPYLQLHEFESLLLANPAQMQTFFLEPEHLKGIEDLNKFVAQFESPEEINHGKCTAPSKQIIKRLPDYEFQKVSIGPAVAEKIGLEELRDKCPHFHEWVQKLENLDKCV